MVKPSDSRNPGITRKGAPRTGTEAETGGAADIRLPLITFSTIGRHNRIQTSYNKRTICHLLRLISLSRPYRTKRRQKKRTPKSAFLSGINFNLFVRLRRQAQVGALGLEAFRILLLEHVRV